MRSVAENQGSPHHAQELHRERRKLISFILYNVLALVLQLEDSWVYSKRLSSVTAVLLLHLLRASWHRCQKISHLVFVW